MYVTCPACRASLEPDEIDRARRECPLCSASLAAVDLSNVEDQLGDESESIAGHPRSVEHRDEEDISQPTQSPSDRQVEIIERSAGRLVMHLPPSSAGSGGIGGFALIWNGFMTVFTTIMWSAFWNVRRFEIALVLFLSVFWLIGISLLIAWIRMRFTRLYLLLEKDRLVIQRKLLGTSNRELLLSTASKATLEESYSVNDVPVFTVTVHGEGRKESFGTGLPPADKEFLADEINAFLGVEPASLTPSKDDEVCAYCGTSLGKSDTTTTASPGKLCEACRLTSEQNQSGQIWLPLKSDGTEALPDQLEIDDTHLDRVLIRYPLLPNSLAITVIKYIVFTVGLAVGSFLVMGIFRAFQQQAWMFAAILSFISLAKLSAVIWILLMLWRGQIQLAISTDAIRMRWGWGPFCFQKLILPETITQCQIVRSLPSQLNKGDTRRAAASPVGFAAIKVGDAAYPLVTFHGIEYGQKVIRLVRTYLKQVTGRELPD